MHLICVFSKNAKTLLIITRNMFTLFSITRNYCKIFYMDSGVTSRLKSSTTHWCVTRYERQSHLKIHNKQKSTYPHQYSYDCNGILTSHNPNSTSVEVNQIHIQDRFIMCEENMEDIFFDTFEQYYILSYLHPFTVATNSECMSSSRISGNFQEKRCLRYL